MNTFSPIEFGAQPTSLTSPGTGSTGKSVMGRDEFLRMLVTQLSNQDPMNPLSGHEFAAQLAQFSSVEQLLNIGDALAKNGEMNGLIAQSINSGVAAGLIGKTIEHVGNQINLPDEGTTDLNFNLASHADDVTISISDASGTVIRKIDLNARSEGKHTIEWDGLDSAGGRVTAGAYTYKIEAKDKAGLNVASDSTFRGRVDRVTFGSNGILLWIGKVSIPMGDVDSVAE